MQSWLRDLLSAAIRIHSLVGVASTRCCLMILAGGMASFASAQTPTQNVLDKCFLIAGAEFHVAIDNKGNWPNLVLLPNGEIAAAIYNHPSHGFGCGDVELWISADQGRSWTFRSKVSDHSESPEKVRMNHAFGLNAKGELVVLVSGWSERRRLPLLPVQVCISNDNGRTWQRHELPITDVPFGKIICSPDGTLTSAWYHHTSGPGTKTQVSRLYTSRDAGRSWELSRDLAEGGCETALLRCRSGKWFAAVRNLAGGPVSLFVSPDDGRTWTGPQSAPMPGYPADLLQLADGKILLTTELRAASVSGVLAAVSNDEGATWSKPMTFVSVPWNSDHGYPSSVQLADGTIVTGYYFGGRKGEDQYGGRADLSNSRGLPWHRRYHMAVMRYRLEDLGRTDKGW